MSPGTARRYASPDVREAAAAANAAYDVVADAHRLRVDAELALTVLRNESWGSRVRHPVRHLRTRAASLRLLRSAHEATAEATALRVQTTTALVRALNVHREAP